MIDITALQKAWCRETSYYAKFEPDNLAKGQCVPTALLVQSILGGDIYGCMVRRSRHFYNIVDGELVDYTAGQFPDMHQLVASYTQGYKSNRDVLLLRPGVADRYELLKERYEQNKKL